MPVKRSSPAKSKSSGSARAAAPGKPAGPRRTAATKARAPAKTVASPQRKVAAKARPAAPKKAAAKAARPSAPPMLTRVVLDALADMKAVDVKAMDVRGVTDITDTMVVASGTSDRHVKSIADRVVQRCKEAGFRPYGMEGERDGEWVLLDLQDLVLHVMLPRVREFYALEKLWDGGAAARRA
ncbi:MAG: ribosome silencing factor [Steroidobacteraceae bacterium]